MILHHEEKSLGCHIVVHSKTKMWNQLRNSEYVYLRCLCNGSAFHPLCIPALYSGEKLSVHNNSDKDKVIMKIGESICKHNGKFYPC